MLFIRQHLSKRDLKFHLYTSPPKSILRGARNTLIEAGLTPAAVVYFGPENPTFTGTPQNHSLLMSSGTCLYVVCLYVCMSACLYVCMSACLHVCMSVYVYVCMSVCLHVCMSVYVYVCMSACLHVCIYVCRSIFE